MWELHVQDNHRGRDEKRPNVWELHVRVPTEGGMRNVLMCGNYMYRGGYRGRDEKRPNVWELHVRVPTEGGMRNVLMCGNYMYRGLQGEG